MSDSTSTEKERATLRAQAQEDVRAVRKKITHLDPDALSLILTQARSYYAWQDKPVDESLLRKIYDITKMGPTSMNCCPARLVFVQTQAGKAKLAKALMPSNVDKTMAAPVTAILAYDLQFWQKLPTLFPHEDRRSMFSDKPDLSYDTAYRNSTLQGAYFMIAARAVGLDVGPMSGFKRDVLDEEFFKGTTLKSNFLCNVGYGDESALFQRLPRLGFAEACSFV